MIYTASIDGGSTFSVTSMREKYGIDGDFAVKMDSSSGNNYISASFYNENLFSGLLKE